MPTNRVITLTNVVQGRLYIDPIDNGNITIQRDFDFVGDDNLVSQIPRRTFATSIAWSAIPTDVQDALITIDNWTNDKILAQEGMT